MVWHIFKKDCRVLWPWVVLMAAMQAPAAVRLTLGLPGETAGGVMLLSFLALLSMLLLIASVVHQDGLRSVRQDWQVRPIRRAHLLLSKLLFVALMAHGPPFLIDCAVGLAEGFPVLDSVRAALLRGIAIGCCFTLPALALATLTRNPVEALAAGLVMLLGFFLLSPATANLLTPIDQRWEFGAGTLNTVSGLAWMQRGAIALTLLLSGAAIVCFRYFRRSTATAFSLLGATVVLVAVICAIPWKVAFAIQQRLAPRPELASGVSLTYEPRPRQWDSGWTVRRTQEQSQYTTVPLRISGLRPDAFLLRDKMTLRVSARDGMRLYSSTNTFSTQFRLDDGARETGNGQAQQTINIPVEIYARVRNEPVRIEIDYALTLATLEKIYTLPVTDVPRHIDTLGSCVTHDRYQPAKVSLRCFSLNKPPLCIQAGQDLGPEEFRRMGLYTDCKPDYAPVGVSLLPGGLHRLGNSAVIVEHSVSSAGWRLHESSAEAKGPVTVRTFTPQAHFTRTVVIANVRLADLEPGERESVE